MQSDLVPGRLERGHGELIVAAFCFLQCKHIDIGRLQPSDDSIDSSPDRVDIPRCDTHECEFRRSDRMEG
ncbi:MAG: hypothetical protein RLZ72_1295 [Actinomycetota bacterium]